MSHAADAHALLTEAIGTEEGSGDWITVEQDRIDAFADTTDDHQFIHVDPEKCKELSPWGVPIAHGFLTLSLLTPLTSSIPQDERTLEGIAMGVNVGFDKVRFLNPVTVGSRIRATSTLAAADLKGDDAVQVTRSVTVEIEGQDKPALVAEWVTRMIYS